MYLSLSIVSDVSSLLISPSPCVPVDHLMLKKKDFPKTSPPFRSRVHQVLNIFIHFPITAATSLFPTLTFISLINIILFPLSISIRHSFTSFQNFLVSSLLFPLLAYTGAFTQTHAYFTIPAFLTPHIILDAFPYSKRH